MRDFAHSIVDTVRHPLLLLDGQLRVQAANAAFYRTFRIGADKTLGRLIYDLDDGQWDIPRLRTLLTEVIPHRAFEDFDVGHDFPRLGRRDMLLNARCVHGDGDVTGMILLAIEDVTDRMRILEDLHHLNRGLPDGAPRTRRILIVDDEPEIRRFCRFALEAEGGTHCDEAADGVAALALVETERYDLVLLDMEMKGMSGAEVCAHLREQPPAPHLKIVMMSGRAAIDELARLLKGPDDILTKPISIIQLQSKVRAALSLKDAQDRADLLSSQLLAVNHELEQTLSARDSDLVRARNGLVWSLAKVVGSRDGTTGEHLLRMEHYSRCLATSAATEFARQIDANYIDLLVGCAPLRDVGKLGLPDHILFKPGKFDLDERLLMQTHTTIWADTLKAGMAQHGSALAFLQMAADIARHHHERFDGQGYPDRLAGNNIPLSARLVAIADVYDALRSRRTYKPALTHAVAVQIMTTASAGQFDPDIVQSFHRSASQFERIFREYAD